MARYESMAWPLATFGMFADPEKIVRTDGLTGSSDHDSAEEPRPHILVIAGEKDVLMKPGVMAKLAGLLRNAAGLAFGTAANGGDAREGIRDGVEFRVVGGSEHHLMGDIEWGGCAGGILGFPE